MGKMEKDHMRDDGQVKENGSMEQSQDAAGEEFLDEPSSPRFGFEIRMGLGVLGVLGFILAAVIAYRLTTLKPADTGEKPSSQAATAAVRPGASQGRPAEPANPSGVSTTQAAVSSSQAQVSEKSAPSGSRQESPPLGLSPPGTLESTSTVKEPDVATARWPALPSSPMNDPSGLVPNPTTSAIEAANMPNGFAALEPNQPVAGNQSSGIPPLPFAQGLDGQQSPRSTPDVSGWNLGSEASHGATQPAGQANSGTFPQSALASSPGLTSPSDTGSSLPTHPFAVPGSAPGVPGDFFSGAAPLSSGNNAAPSAGPTGDYAASPPSLPWSPNPTPTPPQGSENAVSPAASNLSPTPGNSGLAGPSARSRPYAPPLVPGGQGASPSPSTDNSLSGGRTYTVQDGETLFDIARQQLGKASRWVEIYQLNRDRLGERLEFFRPGLTLILPVSDPQPANPVR